MFLLAKAAFQSLTTRQEEMSLWAQSPFTSTPGRILLQWIRLPDCFFR